MAVGNKSGMAGGSVPLNGESIIKQQSSATDVLTIQFASGTPSGSSAGRGLVLRTYVDAGSPGPIPSTASEVFSVDYLGNVYAKGGITLGASAALAIPVTTVADLATATAAGIGGWGSTTLALSASHAGKILVCPSNSGGEGVITLPISSAVPIGTTFKLYFSGAGVDSGIRISSTLNSSDDVRLPSGATGEVFQVTATGLQVGSYIEIVNITAGHWLGLPGGSTAAAWSATAAAA